MLAGAAIVVPRARGRGRRFRFSRSLSSLSRHAGTSASVSKMLSPPHIDPLPSGDSRSPLLLHDGLPLFVELLALICSFSLALQQGLPPGLYGLLLLVCLCLLLGSQLLGLFSISSLLCGRGFRLSLSSSFLSGSILFVFGCSGGLSSSFSGGFALFLLSSHASLVRSLSTKCICTSLTSSSGFLSSLAAKPGYSSSSSSALSCDSPLMKLSPSDSCQSLLSNALLLHSAPPEPCCSSSARGCHLEVASDTSDEPFGISIYLSTTGNLS